MINMILSCLLLSSYFFHVSRGYLVEPTPFTLTSYSSSRSPRFRTRDPPRYVLDVGCGNGESTRDLACREQAVVIGMDNKKSCIHTAQSMHPGLLFVKRDAFRTNFNDDTFHHIQIRLSLLEFNEISRHLVEEMHRILHPEGCLEIVDYALNHPFLAEIAELPEPYRSRLYPQWVFHDPYDNYRIFHKQFDSVDLPVLDPDTQLVHSTMFK